VALTNDLIWQFNKAKNKPRLGGTWLQEKWLGELVQKN